MGLQKAVNRDTHKPAAEVDDYSSPKEPDLPVGTDVRMARRSMSWIETIERDRPLIVVREKKLHVPGADEDHQKQPDIQARLVEVYQRQQDEIEMLVQHVTHNNGVLVRQPGSAPDDAERYIVKATSVNLAQAFRRYQTAEKLAIAIARYEERLNALAAALSGPSAVHRFVAEAGAQIEKAIREIRDHLTDSPDHLHRAETSSLVPEAPAHLHALWHFHAPSRLFRDRIVAAVMRMTDFEVEPTTQIGAPTDASANRPLAGPAQPAQGDGPLPDPQEQTANGAKDAQKAALAIALQNGLRPTR